MGVFKNKTIFFVLILSVVILGAVFVGHADAVNLKLNVNYPEIPAPGGGFDLNCVELRPTNSEACDPTIANIILFIFYVAIWIGGIVAFVSLIYAGLQFIIAGENPSVRSAARERLQNVMWGIVILLLTVLILNVINPAITKLKEPTLKGVGCAQWNGDEDRCDRRSTKCRWAHNKGLCQERIKDIDIPPPPSDDDGDGIVGPGTFSCIVVFTGINATCEVKPETTEIKCSRGFAPLETVCTSIKDLTDDSGTALDALYECERTTSIRCI